MEEVRAFQQSAEAGPGSTRGSVEPEVPRDKRLLHWSGYEQIPQMSTILAKPKAFKRALSH